MDSKTAFRKSPPRPTSQPVPPGVLRRLGTRQSAEAGGVSGERPRGASSPRRDAERRPVGIPCEGTPQVPGVTLPRVSLGGVSGEGPWRGSRCTHLPTAPAPAPPGSRAPRRAAARPPEGNRGRPWPVAEAFPHRGLQTRSGRPQPAAGGARPGLLSTGTGTGTGTSAGGSNSGARRRCACAAGGGATLARVPRGGAPPRPATLKVRFHWPISHVRETGSLTPRGGARGAVGGGDGQKRLGVPANPPCKLTSMSPR